ncbi:MAG: OsmC family protein [Alphaproteobacteria bacterium]|nr:OsmC family protein [Alphaproteobacteria bacterium]MBV9372280.1 OsmC family protein [Alphaproteobacteria bacterium]MBV9899572.1 OsmC family protein [Alphaproteobacteria bacterium]
MSPVADPHAVVVEDTGEGAYQVEVRADGIRFLADEPAASGGLGSGPAPYQLLGAALGACTVITLKLYAERKGMALDRVRATVRHERDPRTRAETFHREIRLGGDLSDSERAKLMEIAERCPVHNTLSTGAKIETLAADDRTQAAILALQAA